MGVGGGSWVLPSSQLVQPPALLTLPQPHRSLSCPLLCPSVRLSIRPDRYSSWTTRACVSCLLAARCQTSWLRALLVSGHPHPNAAQMGPKVLDPLKLFRTPKCAAPCIDSPSPSSVWEPVAGGPPVQDSPAATPKGSASLTLHPLCVEPRVGPQGELSVSLSERVTFCGGSLGAWP